MKKPFVVLFALFFIGGCVGLEMSPTTDIAKYKILGEDIGTMLKATDPGFVMKVRPWADGVLTLSDPDLLSANVLQTAFTYLIETRPDDAALILLIKSSINLFGIKLDAGGILPEDQAKYLDCVRALLTGYQKATKGVTAK